MKQFIVGLLLLIIGLFLEKYFGITALFDEPEKSSESTVNVNISESMVIVAKDKTKIKLGNFTISKEDIGATNILSATEIATKFNPPVSINNESAVTSTKDTKILKYPDGNVLLSGISNTANHSAIITYRAISENNNWVFEPIGASIIQLREWPSLTIHPPDRAG